MTLVFAELNRKDHHPILMPGAPEDFEPEAAKVGLFGTRTFLSDSPRIRFPSAFVIRQEDPGRIARGTRRVSR